MENARNTARIFKAFCDENRIRILRLLRNGEKCGCELLEDLQMSQPNLSHHMRILCDAGVVDSTKAGRWTHYSLSEEGMHQAAACLEEFMSSDKDS